MAEPGDVGTREEHLAWCKQRALALWLQTSAELLDAKTENERLRTALETLQREHLTCTPLRRANVIDRALSRGPEASWGGRNGGHK